MFTEPCLDAVPITSLEAFISLCYPRPTNDCPSRIEELRRHGVEYLCMHGKQLVPRYPRIRILGKGHSSTAVLALYKDSHIPVVVKSLRSDAKRPSLLGEGMLLLRASRHGASPRPYVFENGFIVMEYIRGPHLEDLLRSNPDAKTLRETVRRALEAARALDTADILHMELSRPLKHLKYTGEPGKSMLVIIDLESAVEGRCGNVVKVAGYIVRRLLGKGVTPELRSLLREYRSSGCPEDLYWRILDLIEGL